VADWPHFPLFLRLDGETVLLVGGGEVALRKARLLRKAGARLRLVAREVHPELLADPQVDWAAKTFDPAQLDAVRLAVAATDDAALNAEVAAAAEARGIWVNVVDDPGLSRVITPSIIDRAPILIAIGSSGAAPVLARRLREQIESWLPAGLGRLADFMGARREAVKRALAPERRRDLWERFLDGPGAEAVLRHDEVAAEREWQALLAAPEAPRGTVYLVGAGPGDPDLLTFKALRLMQACDVVLYDRLIPQAILDLVRRDAERVFVGKRRDQHTLPQDEINAELLRRAQAGQRVLRLKGGDPFIFGRGGEEIEPLARAGVPFVVVPGITAASGCAAYAGIPLTHRDHAQTCLFVTGHARADGVLSLPWDTLARRGQTVVVYMGLATLATLCARFVEHGLPGDWPAALVVNGTQPGQQVLVASLDTLPGRVAAADVQGAALLIVGQVVGLHALLGSAVPGAAVAG
jgi:uroporphyrin-III C-methyltransferase / precorrin-2 dehydrogenase / sirohydrochlorin ferrochelatase